MPEAGTPRSRWPRPRRRPRRRRRRRRRRRARRGPTRSRRGRRHRDRPRPSATTARARTSAGAPHWVPQHAVDAVRHREAVVDLARPVLVGPRQEHGDDEYGSRQQRQDAVADPVAAQQAGLSESARTLHGVKYRPFRSRLERARGALEPASNAADRGGSDSGGKRDEADHERGARRVAGARRRGGSRRLRAAGPGRGEHQRQDRRGQGRRRQGAADDDQDRGSRRTSPRAARRRPTRRRRRWAAS